MIKVTGLWKNESKDGKQYLKGKLSPITNFVIFPNDRKASANEPDYILYLDEVKKRPEDGREKAAAATIDF